MKRLGCSILFLTCLLFSLSARPNTPTADHRDTAKARYTYFEAIRLKGSGQHAEAFDLLRHAIALDSTLAAAYSEVAGYYFTFRLNEEGYRALLTAARFAPQNTWYILSAAECARQLRDYTRADSLYGVYMEQKPSDIEVLARRAEVCLLNNEPQKAIDAYNRFEEQYGVNEQILLQKANIYYRMQAREQSFEEMKRLIASRPREVNYILLLGDLYLEAARYDDALQMYNRAREVDPESDALHYSLLNYHRMRNEKEAYLAQADTVLFRTELSTEIKLSILPYLVQILTDDMPRLNKFLTQLCDRFPNDANLRKLYSEVLIHAGDYTGAREQIETALDIAPDDDLWQQLFMILADKNENAALIDAAQRAIKTSPREGRYYLIAASSQLVDSLCDEAEATLLTGLAVPEIAENPLMRSSFYSLYGDIEFRRNNNDKAFAYYEKSLEDNPKNYEALNNYSYYLALLGRDLEKAERMSGEVIKAFPENPTYLDTYAWVYFMQGRYSLARLYLKKAIDLSTTPSAEMYEHYGDVLAVTGNETEALEWWTKAAETGGGSTLLKRKIATKKYIENE